MQELILLPGLDGTRLLFGPLVRLSPSDVACHPVEYPRGAANSYEDLLPLVLSSLPSQGEFFLLGWSFSGPLALMAAARRPPNLRGVILASSFVRKPIALMPGFMSGLMRPALFRLFPMAAFVRNLLGGGARAPYADLLAKANAYPGPEALACRTRSALRVDARHALQDCPVPVLCLRATRDGVIAASRAAEILRLRPASTAAAIEGPHLALLTNPGEAWSAIDSFMKSVDSSAL